MTMKNMCTAPLEVLFFYIEKLIYKGPKIAIHTILICRNHSVFTSMHKQSVKQQSDMFSLPGNKAGVGICWAP